MNALYKIFVDVDYTPDHGALINRSVVSLKVVFLIIDVNNVTIVPYSRYFMST